MKHPSRSVSRQARGADDGEAWYWRGRAHLDAQSWDEAARAFTKALKTAPKQALFFRARALAWARLDRFGPAIADLRQAIRFAPHMALAHSDLGVNLLKIHRAAEAVGSLETALKIDPELPQARICLGLALAHAGMPDRALDILDETVAHDPDPQIHVARAWAMLGQGRVEDALATLARALALAPDHPVANYNFLFTLQHKVGVDAEALFVAHRRWGSKAGALPLDPAGASAPGPASIVVPGSGGGLSARSCLRLGIVSGDLRRHAVSALTLRVFEALARRGHKLVCFSNQSETDEMTQRWRRAARTWHVVDEMEDDALAALIVREKIDVLFDLTGLTARHRLPVFARRVAPLQVTWAGYTGTTGLDTMDLLIADAREVPLGEDRWYSERVVRLPDCYVCYDPPRDAPECSRAPRDGAGAVFGCFQRAAKLNEPLLALWARIAEALPDARFVLRYGSYGEQQTQRVVRAMAERAGLDPERLIFERGGNIAHMMEGYRHIDVALDTRPYSGGVTTLEALWMGVPVVTWPGETFAGRHSASHLHAVGLGELVVGSAEAYVREAVALARDPERRDAYRRDLRSRILASPLNEADVFADNLMTLISQNGVQSRPP